jgi:uncharacterized protein YbjT (DUF2867 family)
MSYIIHGATGAQGAPLLRRLTKSGKRAIAAVHRNKTVLGIETVSIDNESVDSLVAAYRDADGVFVHLPIADEAARVNYAHKIAQAIAVARPQRVVISTSGAIVDDPKSPLQSAPESAIAILIEEVGKTGVSMAVVAPRLYLENMLLPMVHDNIVSEGVLRYPVRDDLAVSWSSHLDVAEVAERLLIDSSVTGVVGVGHLPGLVGEELAAGFAQYLGRPVRFEKVAPLAFKALLVPMLGEAAASGVTGLYLALQGVPSNTIATATSAQQLLGLSPRTLPVWLAELAAAEVPAAETQI